MNNRFLILLIIMFLALLWWTRYQQIGPNAILDRLTGKVYIITQDEWYEIGIDKRKKQ